MMALTLVASSARAFATEAVVGAPAAAKGGEQPAAPEAIEYPADDINPDDIPF